MSNRKNNHYVPKLYLRLFSCNNDKKSINLFNISSGKIYHSCSIKNQASKPYFYGKNTPTEEYLSELETMSAPILHSIVNENKLPTYKSEEHLRLLAFIANLAMRTPKSIEGLDENLEKFMKLYLSSHKEYLEKYGEESFKDIKLGIANSSSFYLAINAFTFLLLHDLSIKILKNETTQPFIISDNPVALYNEFMQLAPHGMSGIGFACKGLEIILPISPSQCLFLFDQDVYKVGDRGAKIIPVKDIETVDILNTLQIINSSENLYFGNQIPINYFQMIFNKGKEGRDAMKPKFLEIPHRTDPNRSLLVSGPGYIRQIFSFSFTKYTKKGKQFIFDNRVFYARNEKILEVFEAFVEHRMKLQ